MNSLNKALYLINPSTDAPTSHGGEVFAASGFAPASPVADLATTTVAAMVPSDMHVTICDEEITPVDQRPTADYIGITGKVTQVGQMIRLARHFRAQGKTVMMGGPAASLSPELLRPHCDILVRGEMEAIAEQFFADLRESRWKDEYDGGRPEITTSPVPRWDLYPNDRALVGALQTSRGCPFQCEFCDVIQYLGRRQRFKDVSQIVAELDVLRRSGYRRIFLSDDNFTVARPRAKEVLSALRAWNHRNSDSGWCGFDTQASIEAAEDEELIHLCSDAGLTTFFVGIETFSEESLRETKKYQNLRSRIGDSIDRLVSNGIAVRAGMIVGFDSDGPDIFERMYEFAMSLPIPLFNLGALMAPDATPLYDRMKREGRLLPSGLEMMINTPLDTNIIPKQMTREELLSGVRWLGNRLFRPAAFLHRLRHFMARFGAERRPERPPIRCLQVERSVNRDTMRLIKDLRTLGPTEAAMCKEIFGSLNRDEAANKHLMEALWGYVQIRHLYRMGNIWTPEEDDDYDERSVAAHSRSSRRASVS